MRRRRRRRKKKKKRKWPRGYSLTAGGAPRPRCKKFQFYMMPKWLLDYHKIWQQAPSYVEFLVMVYVEETNIRIKHSRINSMYVWLKLICHTCINNLYWLLHHWSIISRLMFIHASFVYMCPFSINKHSWIINRWWIMWHMTSINFIVLTLLQIFHQ